MATEFGTGLGANLVTEIVKSIFGTIKSQVLYVFKHKSYVNDLKDQVQRLNLKRERVEVDVDHARRQGDEIHKDVGKWLEDVNRFVQQEADPIIENEGQVGTCSLIDLYKVGRKAVNAAKAGCSLLRNDFISVSYCPALQRTESMYVDRDYEAFDSRESILLEIMEALKDPHVNRIGVYGMGGVGKTTLVKKVAWQAKEDKLFDNVIMVEVTEKPDYEKIQEKIAFDLDLKFEHESEFERAGRIRNRLKKGKRVLVILDNIWNKPDFDAIGIPSRTARGKEDNKVINDDQMHYKILVTSRRLDILRNYMETSKNFYVQALSNNEAQHLFWKIVNSVEKIDFHGVAEEIILKCGGLPLAVATIANALKYKDLFAWNDALHKLKASNSRGIPEIDENLFSVIKLSLDLLNSDEAKSLLLLISLVDAGVGISHKDLLKYVMGLRLFEDIHTLEQGRNRVATLISDLKASCLLLEGGTRPWAKMHEVVHVVAASIASTNKCMFNIPDISNINRILEEKISESPTAISLPLRDIRQLPERLECPKLELFFLFMKSHCLKIPNNFFERVEELKVVDLTCIDLMSVPSSFGYLTNLRTLCLDDCLLGDISIIGKLTNLEILSFQGSNIEQLPREIGQLTRLQLLDLSKCSSLKVIPANVISRLSQLEELDFDKSFVEWEDALSSRYGCNANLVELNQLPHLTSLRLCILDAQIIPSDLFIQELKRFKILIGNVGNWSHNIEASKTLKLKLNKNSCSRYGPIKRLLTITDDLFLDELNDVQDVLYELNEEGFKNLKYLHVQNGPKLRYIVNADRQIPFDAFLKLEVLSLNSLVDLVKICDGLLKDASFNKLKVVKVNKCDELKHLFSISMAKCLSQLQDIEVTDCKNLQGIFAEENDGDHWHDDSEANHKTKFTQLRSLTLQFLPRFTSFCFNKVSRTEIIMEDGHEDLKMIKFPCLENLILSSINIENISSVNISYHSLGRLDVEGCSGLKFLFSSSMVKSLMQLQQLKISKCELMEEVIDSNGLEREATSFPKLEYLLLEDLPNLKRFGVGNLVDFPSMITLFIFTCPNLMTFFSNSTCEITRNKTEEINSEQSIQPLFDEKTENIAEDDPKDFKTLFGERVTVPNLEKLVVLKCNNLKSLFPASIANGFLHLKELEIASSMVEEIVAKEEVVVAEKERISEKLFPKLDLIRLIDLPKLKRFCSFTGDLIELFSLSTLLIDKCPNMETFISNSISIDMTRNEPEEMNSEDKILANRQPLFHEKVSLPNLERLAILHMDSLRRICEDYRVNLYSFSKLREMVVRYCNQLLHIFPPIMHGKRLQKLEKLKVLNCNSLEEILKLEARGGGGEIVFKELKRLRLGWLPSLRGFYMGNCTLKLPSLDDVIVGECSKMEIFSRGIAISPKLQRVRSIKLEDKEKTDEEDAEDNEWHWEGDLNTTIQYMFKKLDTKSFQQD